MSKYIKDQAIILKRINYKDADRILTLYTRENGKLSANAKGIRKLLSKKRSHLELLNLSNIYIVKTGDRHLVIQAELINSFTNIKSDLNLTTWGYYIAEIFEKLVPEEEANATIFDLLQKTLEFIDEYKNPNILIAYNLKLIKILGFYSSKEFQNVTKPVREYLYQIERNSFEEILKMDTDINVIRDAQKVLFDITEEIVESRIKTTVVI